MIVAVSGIRALAQESHADVERAIGYLLDVDGIRFGGADGVDTVALASALELVDASCAVIVPGRLADQPAESQRIARRASQIVELGLGLSRDAYLRRNDALLEGADMLLAFTDGRRTGGTAHTIRRARRAKIPVVIVPVLSEADASRTPRPFAPRVHAILPYVSPVSRPRDRASSTLRAARMDDVTEHDLTWLAEVIAGYIVAHDELAQASCLVPLPTPRGYWESMPLLERIAQCTGQSVRTDLLSRETRLGEVARFGCAGMHRDERVVIIDHFLTRDSELVRALETVRRATRLSAPGLALFSSLPVWAGLSGYAAASRRP